MHVWVLVCMGMDVCLCVYVSEWVSVSESEQVNEIVADLQFFLVYMRITAQPDLALYLVAHL
jgi:hypothetical protein